MRILQYNILKGCQGDPDRRKRLEEWLKNRSYDIVGFNELNGWNIEPGIKAFANQIDYPYYWLFETQHSPFFIGVVSHHPITILEEIGTPFFHGVLHFLIRDIHFIITHLTHVSIMEREKEAETLSQKLAGIKEPAVLMGDLNTLSPIDQKFYDQIGLVRVLNSEPLLKNNFLDKKIRLNYRPCKFY
jgi:endonuclease/exonuclease/phosphatase family metal-dependent hydrolase